ncbi:MAG: hypothetical protein IJS97_08560, partial [Prevotella sp.]|nr:hypothetical protein [Prevotella sp.]
CYSTVYPHESVATVRHFFPGIFPLLCESSEKRAESKTKRPKKRVDTDCRLHPRTIYFSCFLNKICPSYFFSMVFSNRNPDAIKTAKINTIVEIIFLPFLNF